MAKLTLGGLATESGDRAVIQWMEQLSDGRMFSAKMRDAYLYAGVSAPDAASPYFWEVSCDVDTRSSKWGYCDTLEEAKALAIANYALNGV